MPSLFRPARMRDEDVSIQAVRAVLVIHGGAGSMRREDMTPEREAAYRHGLEEALRAGYAALRTPGGTALDAVEVAVRSLEDCSLFNAGRGSVLTHDGHAEMDAAIMDGTTGRAGSVTGVTTVRNPISLARSVAERSPFVLLCGAGAEDFAGEVGADREDPSYFQTEERQRQLDVMREREAKEKRLETSLSEGDKFGTVGAVAVDVEGHVAAATSTGGMTNKRFGRVGDSPVIGAGTWADDNTCAVSATGHGEFFLRCAAAHEVSSRMAYLGESVAAAADAVVNGTLKAAGGNGGMIVIDRHGNAVLPCNTSSMYRGYITGDGQVSVAIFMD